MDITWLTFIKKLLQLIITPKNKWLLGTLSAILLFTPQQHLAQLGLAHIAHNHKTTAGIIFTICALYLTINLTYRLIHTLAEKSRQRTTATRTHRALQTLTDEQRETLRPLTAKSLTCGLLPCDQESTQRLVDTGILIPTGIRFLSTSRTVQHLREYTLSPIARQHFYGKD
ncbi:MAG: superinfection exclusion B family protein [Akkermansia sp.]|nr:superinfection exclusion B family protein [Akkermansia sp.]